MFKENNITFSFFVFKLFGGNCGYLLKKIFLTSHFICFLFYLTNKQNRLMKQYLESNNKNSNILSAQTNTLIKYPELVTYLENKLRNNNIRKNNK